MELEIIPLNSPHAVTLKAFGLACALVGFLLVHNLINYSDTHSY